MHKHLIMLLTIFIICVPAYAKHLHTEAEYQTAWCNAHGGVMEYELPDRARVDCMATIDRKKYAIEFDFAHGAKIYECIGQALYYSLMTDRKAGSVLILETPQDEFYLQRFKKVAKKYKIRYWTMTPADLEQMNTKCPDNKCQ